MDLRIPRLRYIAGRYFWRPTKAVKALGFVAEALGSDLQKAIARAQTLNAAVDASRSDDQAPSVIPGSVSDLAARYQASPVYSRLAPKTQQEYRKLLVLIERMVGKEIVRRLTQADLAEGYEIVAANRGLPMANALWRVWRVLLGYAVRIGMIDRNPLVGFRLILPPPRSQVWTRVEVEALCTHAPASVALAVRIALDIGQRQADILALTWEQWDGAAFTLTQRKTGTRVRLPVSDAMAVELNALGHRRGTIIVSETTGRPYRQHHFVHAFARAREAAGIRSELQFRDLRRTTATELGRAGATDDEIRSITGHKSRGVVGVYVRPDDRMAAAAQRKRSGKSG
jgi:integrase